MYTNTRNLPFCANHRVGAWWDCEQQVRQNHKENYSNNSKQSKIVKIISSIICDIISVFSTTEQPVVGGYAEWQWTAGAYGETLAANQYVYWPTNSANEPPSGVNANPETISGSATTPVLQIDSDKNHVINMYGANQSLYENSSTRRARCELRMPSATIDKLNNVIWCCTYKSKLADNLNPSISTLPTAITQGVNNAAIWSQYGNKSSNYVYAITVMQVFSDSPNSGPMLELQLGYTYLGSSKGWSEYPQLSIRNVAHTSILRDMRNVLPTAPYVTTLGNMSAGLLDGSETFAVTCQTVGNDYTDVDAGFLFTVTSSGEIGNDTILIPYNASSVLSADIMSSARLYYKAGAYLQTPQYYQDLSEIGLTDYESTFMGTITLVEAGLSLANGSKR